jgi:hypothetical protein
MENYPEMWAAVYGRRLGNGIGWKQFRSCLADPANVAALRESLPPGLLSDALAAATSPEPDPTTMRRLASRLDEWLESRRAAQRVAGPTSNG